MSPSAQANLDDRKHVGISDPESTPRHNLWKVELSPAWDVLGPFPIHAREQHFLSPCFPLDLASPYTHEPDRTWFSSYVDNGIVTWTTAHSDESGSLSVSFTNVRWDHLRATEGWAILQYQAVLHTTLTVIPPHASADMLKPPRLRVNLSQAAFFAVLPREPSQTAQFPVPEWHIGNVYDLHGSCANSVQLPSRPDVHGPTIYDLFVCGNYEIRLFGDPRALHIEQPILQLLVSAEMEARELGVIRDESIDVVCDFVGGYAFGDCIGLGFRSVDGWWAVKRLESAGGFPSGFSLSLVSSVTFAPSQRRLVAIRLSQCSPCYEDTLKFAIQLTAENEKGTTIVLSIPVVVKFRHHRVWWLEEGAAIAPIRATCMYASTQPTSFLVIPPFLPNENVPRVPILALHGAGVDIFVDDFWIKSLNRQRHHWIVVAIGRTEWGLDWHGPSAREAWATVSGLDFIINRRERFDAWRIDSSRVVLMGHSNGGQGTWYLASRYPDKIVAAIPAAAYLKAQNYVPLTYARSSHYIDPALRGILDASSAADDNDLFLSNVVGIPLLAVHGGDDGNVPTWHSREYVNTALEWANKSDCGRLIAYHEDPQKPHWYSSVFSTQPVQTFLDSVLSESVNQPRQTPTNFTFTVADPANSGSMYGWNIIRLRIPGRLGRLTVSTVAGADGHDILVRTVNISAFSILPPYYSGVRRLCIDTSSAFDISAGRDRILFTRSASGAWKQDSFTTVFPARHGRAQNILTSPSSLTIVIPSGRLNSRAYSVALRLAHSLDTYLRLDCDIRTDVQVLRDEQQGTTRAEGGNVIAIGGFENVYTRKLLMMESTEFTFVGEQMAFRGDILDDPELGIMFTHPHPTCHKSLVLFLIGNSASALERVFCLFPIRTGISVPDWVLISGESDRLGAAGLIGAGTWNNEWKWNEAMSWYR